MAIDFVSMVNRMISGGQTGVDRAALDFALQEGIECGGWIPKGRMAEDGIIPAKYSNLKETESENPKERTERNVQDSDGTLVITRGNPSGGSAFTLQVARHFEKPVLHVDLERESMDLASLRLREWIQKVNPAILNIAGSRNSEDRKIYELTKTLLEMTFRQSRS